jgi:formate dehydrogenase major subunit
LFPDELKGSGGMTKIQFGTRRQQVEGNAGETIWQVANAVGREIPHLCYIRRSPYFTARICNCRACMVEIESELAASCKRTPSVGMSRKIESAPCGLGAQKMVMELLVADQPARATSHDPGSEISWHWAGKDRGDRAGFRRPNAGMATAVIRR